MNLLYYDAIWLLTKFLLNKQIQSFWNFFFWYQSNVLIKLFFKLKNIFLYFRNESVLFNYYCKLNLLNAIYVINDALYRYPTHNGNPNQKHSI